MSKELKFDPRDVHRYYSAECFNRTWDFIAKADRTPEDNERMILSSMASLWHWTQREDCVPRNLSIGYWQASRVHALAGLPHEALRYGRLCLEHSKDIAPFFLAYAHEALARAEKVAGNAEGTARHRAEASRLAEFVDKLDDRKLLLDDLETI